MKFILAALMACLTGAAMAKDATPDTSFYKNVAEAGMAEVDAGKLAQGKATSKAVKDFGAMMVKDHTAANDKLKSLATSKGVKLPDDAGMVNKAKYKMLEMKDGANFDHDYVKSQIKGHEDVAEMLRKEIKEGKDMEAMSFAKEVLPTVEAHLKSIRQIGLDMGVKE